MAEIEKNEKPTATSTEELSVESQALQSFQNDLFSSMQQKSESPAGQALATSEKAASSSSTESLKELLPQLKLEGYTNDEIREIIKEKMQMQKAREKAAEHVDDAMDYLKNGDYKKLAALAIQLQDKNQFGAQALQELIKEKSGVNVSFRGAGKGGMEISFNQQGFDIIGSDIMKHWTSLKISPDGEMEAFKHSSGGIGGGHRQSEIPVAEAEAELQAALARNKK